jgi:hypothetical protein
VEIYPSKNEFSLPRGGRSTNQQEEKLRAGSHAYLTRGIKYVPDESDVLVEKIRPRKQPYDIKLKAYAALRLI